MADRQYVVPGQGSAPFAWVLSPDLQIVPKIAYASFDGTAAAGAFLPCLRLVSDSGHVAAESVSATQVAAGGSADVTWFRGLKRPCPPNGWPNDNHTDEVLLFGPWAYWKMDEPAASGTAADASGHGRTITHDSSFTHLGSSSIVPTTADTCSWSDWTSATNRYNWHTVSTQTWAQGVCSLEYWINTPGHAGNEMTIGCMGTIGAPTSSIFYVSLDASLQPVFQWLDSGNVRHTVNVPVGVTLATTQHLVFVLDGATLTTYLNGAQADQQVAVGTLKVPFTADAYVGQALGGAGSRYYTGFMQHIAWYDKALSAANVATLYAAGTQI